ncbi:MAG TPA: RNA polymerase factor sigma-54 [Balneolaceae bacterium]|nr:RNA polymerase factor sigma-54 [Balneolaceae bacterium]
MLRTNQNISQKLGLKQKLSPQQIQFVKLLQLPSIGLEQRVKQEIEMNPVLEEADPLELEEDLISLEEDEWPAEDEEISDEANQGETEIDPVDKNTEIDWDTFLHNTEFDGSNYQNDTGSNWNEEWKDLPNPYHESLLEELEAQVQLLNLDDHEKLIADQILGSLDEDGYFRREIEAVVDNIAFNHGVLLTAEQVNKVRRQIQRLEPVGIASTDLQDCLIVQLELSEGKSELREKAIQLIRNEWGAFEKKHFDKLKNRLQLDDEQLKEVFELIKSQDPRPGATMRPDLEVSDYIEPDFEVYYEPADSASETDKGSFVIRMNQRNSPTLRISPEYKSMWENMKSDDATSKGEEGAKEFIKEKVESARWFIESIRQRHHTLMSTMRAIVAFQEDFFKHGKGLRPMILNDVADRIGMDISTVSRVVNGKYVQTHFGVFELKYFFSEGLETESGEEVSSREVKKLLQNIVDNEDKEKPFSDQVLTDKLREKGFKVARRTVSKYRESMQIPVARLRRQLL